MFFDKKERKKYIKYMKRDKEEYRNIKLDAFKFSVK
jgi:hypothetical protein